MFMQTNGWDLQFADNEGEEFTELAKIVIKATVSEISKEELMEWFEVHKVSYQDE